MATRSKHCFIFANLNFVGLFYTHMASKQVIFLFWDLGIRFYHYFDYFYPICELLFVKVSRHVVCSLEAGNIYIEELSINFLLDF